MAVNPIIPEEAASGSSGPDGELRYVARQPILDLHGRVYGYELLFRNGREMVFRGDGDLATRTMLDNTVIFGFDMLTSGLPAFVNCTREALIEGLVRVLPPSMTVLEIVEDIEPTPDIVDACTKLKAAGYRLALDDFLWKPGIQPLVDLADFIKVDFSLSDEEARRHVMSKLAGTGMVMIAEKIETPEMYQQARKEGFNLIQGYYFCHPVLLENRKIPANRISQIEILRALRSEDLDLRLLTDLVKRDASLTYRLLRLVNSPVCGRRQEVHSIHEALLAIGENAFRRMATLAITSEFNSNQPVEILHMAFVRARFCELAASLCLLDATEQYLLGLLSLLPAMLRLPIDHIAPMLSLRKEIRQALLGEPVPERCLLDWLVANEYGDWAACDSISAARRLNQEDLARCQAEAIRWAEFALQCA